MSVEWIALIVAVASAAASIVFGCQQHVHNKNAVRPIFDYSSDKFPHYLSMAIQNKGPGPMHILRLRFICEDKEASRITDVCHPQA